MKTKSNTGASDSRLVEAEAFRDGANGVSSESGLAELRAHSARLQAEVRDNAALAIRELEGRSRTLRGMAEEASARWTEIRERQGNDQPYLFRPLVLGIVAMGATVAEAFLLAPMLDAVGMPDPVHQLLTATGAILAVAIIIHYCLDRRAKDGSLWPLLVTGGVFVGLVTLGLFRAEQIAFAASISESVLNDFLRQNMWLSRAVMVFLTVLFPVAVTLVPHWCLEELHRWSGYRSARRQAEQMERLATIAEKDLAAHQDKLAGRLEELDEQAKEWQAAYETFYALGKTVGACQRPRWTVWAKSAAVAVLAFLIPVVAARLLTGEISHAALSFSAVLAAAAGLAAAAHFHRRWAHPSAMEYLRMVNLQFREPGKVTVRPPARALPPSPAPVATTALARRLTPNGGATHEEVM